MCIVARCFRKDERAFCCLSGKSWDGRGEGEEEPGREGLGGLPFVVKPPKVHAPAESGRQQVQQVVRERARRGVSDENRADGQALLQ